MEKVKNWSVNRKTIQSNNHQSMKKAILLLVFGCLVWASPSAQVVNGSFTTDYTTFPSNFNPNHAFEQGRVNPWNVTHGSPSISNHTTNPHAYMWSQGNQGEGIFQYMNFPAGCHEVSMKVRTGNNGVNDPNVNNGRVRVSTAQYIYTSSSNHNPMIQPAGSSHGWTVTLHHVIDEQAGQFLGTNWHTVSGILNVTALHLHNMLIIHPHMAAASTSGSQLELRVDDVQVAPVGQGASQFHFENQNQQSQTVFQPNEPVYVDGSACQFETHYYIDIWSRPLGTANPGPFVQRVVIGWSAGQVGTFNLSALAAQHGFAFSPGMEYQVKVAVQNQPCFNWTESTQVFQVPHSNPPFAPRKSASAQGLDLTADDISLYPNPATDKVWLEMPIGMDNVTAEILNVNGQRVAVQNLAFNGGNREALDVSHLPSGSYVLLLQDGDQVFRKRLTVAQD